MGLAIEDLKAQANSFDFFGAFFRENPNEDWFRTAIKFIMTWKSEDVDDSNVQAHLKDSYEMLSSIIGKEGLEPYISSLLKEYERLFFAPGRVPVNLYESFYRENGLLMQETTIAVRQHYLRAGLVVKALYAVPDDHIATELEYMKFLIMEQVQKLERGCLAEETKELESWQGEFMSEHLKQWIPSVAESIRENTSDPFFKIMGFGLEALLME